MNGGFVFEIIVYPLNTTSLFFGRGFFIKKGLEVSDLKEEDMPN